MSRSRVKDISGNRYGKLVAVELAPKKKSWTMWKCKCDCGNTHTTYSTHLIRGNITSCGCDAVKKGAAHAQWTGYGEISGQRWNLIRRINMKNERKSRSNIEFNIDIKYAWELYIKQNRKCALSGIPIYFKSGSQSGFTASLDRIDPTKNYDEDNVQWVHKDINRMKNIYSQEYFISMCCSVAENNKKE